MCAARARAYVAILLPFLVAGAALLLRSRGSVREGSAGVGRTVAGPEAGALAAAPQRQAPSSHPKEPTARQDAEEPEILDPSDRPSDWSDSIVTARLRVTCVDAATGRPLDVRWRLRAPSQGSWPPGHPLPGEDKASDPRSITDDRHRRPGDAAAVGIWEARAVIRLELDVPQGFVDWEEGPYDATVAAGVGDLRVIVPLHRALGLDVSVLGPDGAPAEGARLSDVRIAGRELPFPEAPADAQGRIHLAGVPFLPGERLTAAVEWRAREAREPEPPPPSERSDGPSAALQTIVPGDSSQPWAVVVRLAGPTRAVGDHNETDNDLPTEEEIVDVAVPPESRTGTVSARALGWDGRALSDARVWCSAPSGALQHVTAADGGAEFRLVPIGERSLRMEAPGRFAAVGRVAVAADATATVVLREPDGGRIDVLVVDAAGDPRPFARIRLASTTGSPALDVAGVVQRVDPFTDETGRRSFHRVPPGLASVEATWGSARASTSLTVRDRDLHTVRLVVR